MAAGAPSSLPRYRGRSRHPLRYGGRSARLQISNHIGDHPTGRVGQFDHSDGAVALLDDDFAALPDLSHNIGDVVHQFSLGHVDNGHTWMIARTLVAFRKLRTAV